MLDNTQSEFTFDSTIADWSAFGQAFAATDILGCFRHCGYARATTLFRVVAILPAYDINRGSGVPKAV